ncbi:MAG TPA: hypothetical protein VEO01_11080, partial [Pseudonocardiaceae bacterium]|nr:hypothetical protein [Pseudonocardiaceae bacterium]
MGKTRLQQDDLVNKVSCFLFVATCGGSCDPQAPHEPVEFVVAGTELIRDRTSGGEPSYAVVECLQ